MRKKFLFGFILLFVFFVMSPTYAKELDIEKINQVSVDNDGYWMAPFANTYKTSDGGYVVMRVTVTDTEGNSVIYEESFNCI